ncbi:reverse transcriptase domain-containing protein [Tanacetum coccineum]
MEFTYALRFRFDATNNEAEYEALIAGLRIAEQMGVKNLQANVDSRLVANQVNGNVCCKAGLTMIRLTEKTPTSLQQSLSKQVLVEELKEKSISEVEVLDVEEEGDTWMTPIFKYLAEESLPTEESKDNKTQAHNIMVKSRNGDTPFSLTYGTEAVIPTEIGMPILRTAEVDLVQNNKALEINLDLLKEKREEAAIRKDKSKAKMEKYYNTKVRNPSFKLGDLVYRNNDASRVEHTGKLSPK